MKDVKEKKLKVLYMIRLISQEASIKSFLPYGSYFIRHLYVIQPVRNF